MSASPTQRTLQECRRREWRADIVERRIRGHVTKDLFGFGDVLVVQRGQQGVLVIQTTTGSNVASRIRKLMGDGCRDAVIDVLRAGNRIEVWGWSKRGARGKRKLWTLRRVWITFDPIRRHLAAVELET